MVPPKQKDEGRKGKGRDKRRECGREGRRIEEGRAGRENRDKSETEGQREGRRKSRLKCLHLYQIIS